MPALSFRIALLLLALFSFLISLIRIQPYNDKGVRALLSSGPGCPMPCFIGIRPGVTTCDQAIDILKNHEWVGEVNADPCSPDGRSDGWMWWFWNGRQPALLDNAQTNSIRIENNVVRELVILSQVSMADIWMLYGIPDLKNVDIVSGAYGPPRILNAAGYPQLGLELTSYSPCPGSYKDFWAAPTVITFTSQPHGLSRSSGEFTTLLVYHNQLCGG